jgi:hypothetical protein
VAGLLWNQIADLFRDFDDGDNLLVVTLLLTLDDLAPLAAKLDGQLLALGVADKGAWLLLVVPSRAGRLEVSLALFLSFATRSSGATSESTSGRLSISASFDTLISGVAWQLGFGLGATGPANLFQRSVALLDGLGGGQLVEGDLTLLLKVLFANFFRRRRELRNVGVVALLDFLVYAFEDGLLLDALDLLLLDDAAEAVLLRLAVAEVDSARNGEFVSDRFFGFVVVGKVSVVVVIVFVVVVVVVEEVIVVVVVVVGGLLLGRHCQ